MAEVEKKPYALKAGAEMHVLQEGELVLFTGSEDPDNPTMVELDEEQAKAFADKLEGGLDPEVFNTKNTQTVVIGTETGGRATIQEGGFLASPGEKLGEGNEEAVNKSADEDEVPAPSGQPVAQAQDISSKDSQLSTAAPKGTAPSAAKQADAKAGAGNSQAKS